MEPHAKLIINLTRGNVVCERAPLADRPLVRMRGLLGRKSLPTGEGLWLTPASSIHTAFMRFAIDAVFVDRRLRVVRLVEQLRPWRAAGSRSAASVLELAGGEIATRGVELGDQLALATSGRDLPYRARVLIVAPDRRFRAVAATLLSRRGYQVLVGGRDEDVVETVIRERAEVVVLDTARSLAETTRLVAKLRDLCPSVGIVAVGDAPQLTLPSLPLLPKWGAFPALFGAIEQATAKGRGHIAAA